MEAERQPATRAVPPPEATQQEADRGSVGGEDGEGPKGGSQVEAARAAARINAMLAAQGKLGSSEMVRVSWLSLLCTYIHVYICTCAFFWLLAGLFVCSA